MNATCAHCSKPFVASKPESRFCSRACYYLGMVGHAPRNPKKRVTVACASCGTEFETGGRSGRKLGTKWCSQACAGLGRFRRGSVARAMSDPEAAYLAGLIEGEGTVMLYRRGRGAAIRLTVANTHAGLLEWCSTATGVGAVTWKAPRNPAKHKPGGWWFANADAAVSILEQIEPYLIIKRRQSEVARAFRARQKEQGGDRSWEVGLLAEMQALNARGPQTLDP